VEGWRDANAEAKLQRAYYQRSAVPEAARAVDAAEARAAAYVRVIEREAVAAGRPDLAAQLRASRVELGRIGTVERALNESTGNVNAQALRQAQDRGVPLTGEMARAANVSRAFRGRVTQPPPAVAPNQMNAAAIMAALGGPKALAWTGLPWATRKVLLSSPVQAMARPARVRPLSSADELRRAAIISALQQEQE
jgi:hypothetical protein